MNFSFKLNRFEMRCFYNLAQNLYHQIQYSVAYTFVCERSDAESNVCCSRVRVHRIVSRTQKKNKWKEYQEN